MCPRHLERFALHTKIATPAFKCGVPGCTRSFSKFTAFKAHLYRDHKAYHRSKNRSRFRNVDATLICHVEFCQTRCENLFSFFSHLKNIYSVLTDIPILSQLEESFPDKGKKIVQYFKNKPTNEVQAVLPLGDENAAAPYVISLLVAYFKEKSDALLTQADVS